METEFEVKILDINVEAIKKKLESLGAKKIMDRNMRRYVYDIGQKGSNKWIRLRDQGDKTTLTIKEIHNDEIDGTKEAEVTVADFDKTNIILIKLGFQPKAYQENKRISYELDGVQIEIDFWPKIPPYLEIEGKNAEEIERVVKKLGFNMSQTTSINTDYVYEKYGLNIYDYKELKF